MGAEKVAGLLSNIGIKHLINSVLWSIHKYCGDIYVIVEPRMRRGGRYPGTNRLCLGADAPSYRLLLVKVQRPIQEPHVQWRPRHPRTQARCGRVQLVYYKVN